ncbi:MAG: toll/interleukin-1 receptor domain-containing protein [Anaerolineae bacterium]|nr:toll/interleukin-1 receptor domain-containing protein [Anaerolineae bacterium]
MQTFISYSRKNEEFAKRLCQWVQAWGYRAWFDQANIAAGANWHDTSREG